MDTKYLQLIGCTLIVAVLSACGTTQSASLPTSSPPTSLPPTNSPAPQTATSLLPTNTPIPPTAMSETIIQTPPARDFYSMAYDIESDKVILFGGYVPMNDIDLKDTWIYDYNTNTWTEATPSESPGDRAGSAMVYDSESDRVIMFGGINTNNEFLKDTWEYDYNTNTWTEMTPPDSPQRAGHAMAYDSESDRVIMFGGGIDFTNIEGTWAYDYNANIWTEMSPDISPPNDHDHKMAYDSESDRVIMWGTSLIGNKNGSVWTYDFNTDTWEEIEPSNGHPKPFAEGSMAYDVTADRIIVHHNLELWAYDYNANAWTELESDMPVPDLYRHAMVYNVEADRMIAFGGRKLVGDESVGQTWVFDLNTVTWTEMLPDEYSAAQSGTAGQVETPTPLPPTATPEPTSTPAPLTEQGRRGYHQMVYDAESQVIILYGGEPNPDKLFTDTWAYHVDTGAWEQVGQTQTQLTPKGGGSLAYDAESDRVILYLNHYFDETYAIDELDFLGETWAYDYNSDAWSNMEAADTPVGYLGAELAYDAESDRVILFGGFQFGDEGVKYFDQTWAYDFNTNHWQQMQSQVSPQPRNYQAMAYHPGVDRVILFGGEYGTFLNDTWAYDYNTDTWEQLEVDTAPQPRIYSSMIYVESLNQMVLFGGTSSMAKKDTWAFDYEAMTWLEYETEQSPSRRAWYGMTYDPAADNVVLYGGGKSRYAFDDQLWFFNPATLTWTEKASVK